MVVNVADCTSYYVRISAKVASGDEPGVGQSSIPDSQLDRRFGSSIVYNDRLLLNQPRKAPG